MQEEYHAETINGATVYKRLYGWSTLTANVWLPSLCELIGYTPDTYNETSGVYWSAMQGLNTSGAHYVDSKGGVQFAYFQQFNASGGGERIWNTCSQQLSWLRSSAPWDAVSAWRITNAQRFDTPPATASGAVHLFVGREVL